MTGKIENSVRMLFGIRSIQNIDEKYCLTKISTIDSIPVRKFIPNEQTSYIH